MSYYL
jgi:hypothetical protein